jgi:hypothetical protein
VRLSGRASLPPQSEFSRTFIAVDLRIHLSARRVDGDRFPAGKSRSIAVGRSMPSHFPWEYIVARHPRTRIISFRRIHGLTSAIKREERKLEKELAKLQGKLSGVRAAAKALGNSAVRETKQVKQRVLSAAGRAKISKAAKARWAKIRAQAKRSAS